MSELSSYYRARDVFDNQAINAAAPDSSTALAVFRFLLSHTYFKGEKYGWVNERWTAQDTLAKVLGAHRNTIWKALKELETAGMIKRQHQSAGKGKGRLPDSIFIQWLEDNQLTT